MIHIKCETNAHNKILFNCLQCIFLDELNINSGFSLFVKISEKHNTLCCETRSILASISSTGIGLCKKITKFYQKIMLNVSIQDGLLLCEDLCVLSDSQEKKLDAPKNQSAIDNYCADMHIDYRHIVKTGNVAISHIGILCEEYDDEVKHELEMKHSNFLSFVDTLENQPKRERSHEEELAFVKKVLESFDSIGQDNGRTGQIACAKLMVDFKELPFFVPCGQISQGCLKRMLQAYVFVYDED